MPKGKPEDEQLTLALNQNEKDREEVIIGENDKRFGKAIYYPNFFKDDEANCYMEQCSKIEWKRESIQIYGKEHLVPRDTAWFSKEGLSYTYSGIPMHPKPYPDFISEIQEKIEKKTRFKFNSVLLNRYNNGKDSVSWHSDDEKELKDVINIASVSFGETRNFQLRKKPRTKDEPKKVNLEHGSLLLMVHPLQLYWEHQIPKRSPEIGSRVNMTFRKISQ